MSNRIETAAIVQCFPFNFTDMTSCGETRYQGRLTNTNRIQQPLPATATGIPEQKKANTSYMRNPVEWLSSYSRWRRGGTGKRRWSKLARSLCLCGFDVNRFLASGIV